MNTPTQSRLSCLIEREINTPIIIGPAQLEEIARIFSQIHQESVDDASTEAEKQFIIGHGPTIEVKVSDGSTYKLSSAEDVLRIRTSQQRRIDEINISVSATYPGAIMHMGSMYKKKSKIKIHSEESRAQYFSNKLEEICKENVDFTANLYMFNEYVYGTAFSALIFYTIYLIIDHLVPNLKLPWVIVLLLVWLAGMLAFPTSLIYEALRTRLVPRTIFLWGVGEKNHKIAKLIVKTVFFSLPIWIAGAFIQTLI